MDRIVRALDVHGLVNAQFIVRDDGVYLIEVNPRASRTVPFMSKVTGVPMVKLAVRIALGETLRGDGVGERPAGRRRRWSRSRRRPSPRPSCAAWTRRSGPGMQSTGEVIGIHADPRVALAKAMQGAALIPPRPGRRRRAGPDLGRGARQGELPRVAAALARAGYRFAATSGTAAELAQAGPRGAGRGQGRRSGPARARSPSWISSPAASVRLVVNTPSPKSGPVRDAAEIRLAATAEGILCLTAIETAVAAAEALDPDLRARLAEVRSLGEWVPEPGKPRGAAAAR